MRSLKPYPKTGPHGAPMRKYLKKTPKSLNVTFLEVQILGYVQAFLFKYNFSLS